MSKNTVHQTYRVTRAQREIQKGHRSILMWFTGLSGSGKSTIANAVEQALFETGVHTYTLDGDNVRQGLNNDLNFSEKDRTENIRRIAEVAKLFVDSGTVVLGAFISPFEKDRAEIKQILGNDNYLEIFVNTSLETCEKRDVKGLYKKARTGEIPSFTGISSPYESPKSPDIEINTEKTSVDQAVSIILKAVETKLKS